MPPKAPKRAYSTGRWCAIINCPFKVSNAVNDGERKFVLWPTKESVQKQWSKVSFWMHHYLVLKANIFGLLVGFDPQSMDSITQQLVGLGMAIIAVM